MTSPDFADPTDVHAALTELAPRLSALVRSITEPEAHAVGNWTAIEVAVHLAHVWETLTALADGEIDSPLQDVGALGALTEDLVRLDVDRDPAALADRIDVRVAAFLAEVPSLGRETAPSPWLVRGIAVPRVAIACHILSESLVHGYDIARAQHSRWEIRRAHAGLALLGFAFPLVARLDARALVDQERARGFAARYEIRVRGAGIVFMEIADGAVTLQHEHGSSIDCHLSADPATLLLLLFGRISQWPAIFTGRLVAWGPKPWLAPRLRQVLRNP